MWGGTGAVFTASPEQNAKWDFSKLHSSHARLSAIKPVMRHVLHKTPGKGPSLKMQGLQLTGAYDYTTTACHYVTGPRTALCSTMPPKKGPEPCPEPPQDPQDNPELPAIKPVMRHTLYMTFVQYRR